MNGLRQDVRGALRLLTRSPGFSGVVILTLALAIGATTSVFSIVRGLLLQPLPYPEAGRLVRFFGSSRQVGTGTISPAEFHADHQNLKTTSGVAAWGQGGASIAAPGGAEHIAFGRATSSLLPVLAVKPAYGRWFTREDEEQGRRVAVLGRALWQRRFASDPEVVGKTVQISGFGFEIIGVLADDLELPEHFDAWRPLSFSPAQLTPQARSARGLRVIGRLARGATLFDLRSEMAVVSARLRASYPDIYPADFGFEMAAVPLLVARESAALVGAGVLLGTAGALASARLIAGLLFGVGPADPLALLGAAAVLGAVSLVATLLPARRAALVDPAVALRAE